MNRGLPESPDRACQCRWPYPASLEVSRLLDASLPLEAGALPQVSKDVLEADCLISVPTVKTHAEMVLSCAMKNWVGIARGQEKRHMHDDLGKNIFAINEVVTPDPILVDGLIVMEGNGPGDPFLIHISEPTRLGMIS